jgi:hypothetical protein
MHDNRKVVTITMPDGTVRRRLARLCKPDRRSSDYVNKVHLGDVQGRVCPRCGVHHRGPCQ